MVAGGLNWALEAWGGRLLICGFSGRKRNRCLLWLVGVVVSCWVEGLGG